MATIAAAPSSPTFATAHVDRPTSSAAYEWASVGTVSCMGLGAYIDGWAHNHPLATGGAIETFFTPWHALLYGGYALVALLLLSSAVLWHARGFLWKDSLPHGYRLSLVGAMIFAFGGALDLLWHSLFGIDVRLGRVPFGTFTVVFGLNVLLVTFMRIDMFSVPPLLLTLGALLAGLITDVLYARLRPSARNPVRLRLFAFCAPALLYATYFVVILAYGGTYWNIHLLSGCVATAGLIGLLMIYLISEPAVR